MSRGRVAPASRLARFVLAQDDRALTHAGARRDRGLDFVRLDAVSAQLHLCIEPAEILQRVTLLRRSLVSLNPVSAMESLVKKLAEYPSNAAFLEKVGTFRR